MGKQKQHPIAQYISFLEKQPQGYVFKGKTMTHASPMPSKKAALEALREKYRACMACPLSTAGRTHVVFGIGNPDATLMFIGEGPGRDEDLQGAPFVGRAGQLLSNIITAMKLTREDVYISNVVKCRPPQNRLPTPEESTTCTNILLFREIDIICPRIICTLGSTATQALLGNETRITRARGIFHTYKNIPVMPTYHPAYLLRNPAAKRFVWDDMKKVIEKLELT